MIPFQPSCVVSPRFATTTRTHPTNSSFESNINCPPRHGSIPWRGCDDKWDDTSMSGRVTVLPVVAPHDPYFIYAVAIILRRHRRHFHPIHWRKPPKWPPWGPYGSYTIPKPCFNDITIMTRILQLRIRYTYRPIHNGTVGHDLITQLRLLL